MGTLTLVDESGEFRCEYEFESDSTERGMPRRYAWASAVATLTPKESRVLYETWVSQWGR